MYGKSAFRFLHLTTMHIWSCANCPSCHVSLHEFLLYGRIIMGRGKNTNIFMSRLMNEAWQGPCEAQIWCCCRFHTNILESADQLHLHRSSASWQSQDILYVVHILFVVFDFDLEVKRISLVQRLVLLIIQINVCGGEPTLITTCLEWKLNSLRVCNNYQRFHLFLLLWDLKYTFICTDYFVQPNILPWNHYLHM